MDYSAKEMGMKELTDEEQKYLDERFKDYLVRNLSVMVECGTNETKNNVQVVVRLMVGGVEISNCIASTRIRVDSNVRSYGRY